MIDKENVLVRIYELRDPRDLECSPRYVGITKNLLKYRLKFHLNKSHLIKNTYKNNWIKSLLKQGIIPTIHLIEEVVGWSYSYKLEKYWIEEFKIQGYKLTNSTDGGEGILGFNHSKETKERMSKLNTGKKHSDETKRKQSESHLGIKMTEENKIKLIARLTGKKYTEITKEKLRKANLGKIMSEETKNKLSISHKKRYENREEILKISLSVIQLDLNGNFIKEWDCIKEAARELGLMTCYSNICNCCKGIRNHTGGYKWEYKDNYMMK